MSDAIRIGIIGGSGLYNVPELTDKEEINIRTPFGKTSDSLITGTLVGERVAFVARHGRGHVLTPTEVPYAANIYALKTLGVKFIISVSACGSLREEFAPGHICIPDQLVDNTKGLRQHTYFGNGVVGHVGVADPFEPSVAAALAEAGRAAGATIHQGGTFVTIEGPRFSTRAESNTFRQLGYDIIGMTTSPEAFLAAEAEIAYAVFAHITDYDVWHEEEANVSAAAVMETFAHNITIAQKAVIEAIPRVAALPDDLPVHSALKGAVMTQRESIDAATYEKMRVLVGDYFGDNA